VLYPQPVKGTVSSADGRGRENILLGNCDGGRSCRSKRKKEKEGRPLRALAGLVGGHIGILARRRKVRRKNGNLPGKKRKFIINHRALSSGKSGQLGREEEGGIY